MADRHADWTEFASFMLYFERGPGAAQRACGHHLETGEQQAWEGMALSALFAWVAARLGCAAGPLGLLLHLHQPASGVVRSLIDGSSVHSARIASAPALLWWARAAGPPQARLCLSVRPARRDGALLVVVPERCTECDIAPGLLIGSAALPALPAGHYVLQALTAEPAATAGTVVPPSMDCTLTVASEHARRWRGLGRGHGAC